jgi:predicted signal transduction protein with EAL and GGDEF domain
VTVSASIGVASVAGRDATTTDLLVEADTAMYRAKAEGGNRTEVFIQRNPSGAPLEAGRRREDPQRPPERASRLHLAYVADEPSGSGS